jgi:OmcA/MtrC family decaheme c-type cytochrome
VDGTPVVPRRTVVAIANCDQCHTKLSLHGENRNQIEMCVLCHNPSEGDESTRPTAVVAADKTQPVQGINFAGMVHRIHTGEKLAEAGLTYTIVGYGGSHNDFSTVRYPAMLNGTTGDTANCAMCHVNGSEAVFPIGKNNVLDPEGLLSPVPPTTAACTACHFDTSSFAHAVLNTDPKFGEACTVCHASGAAFDVIAEHAGQ